MSPRQKLIILCLLGCLGLLIYWPFDSQHYLNSIQDGQLLLAYLQSFEIFGPIMVVVMMSVANMVSPSLLREYAILHYYVEDVSSSLNCSIRIAVAPATATGITKKLNSGIMVPSIAAPPKPSDRNFFSPSLLRMSTKPMP